MTNQQYTTAAFTNTTKRDQLSLTLALQFGGKLDWGPTAICGDDHTYGGQGNPSSGERFHAAPNIDHRQKFVRDGICEWLAWLRTEIGFDGYRLDFAKGFGGVHFRLHMHCINADSIVRHEVTQCLCKNPPRSLMHAFKRLHVQLHRRTPSPEVNGMGMFSCMACGPGCMGNS